MNLRLLHGWTRRAALTGSILLASQLLVLPMPAQSSYQRLALFDGGTFAQLGLSVEFMPDKSRSISFWVSRPPLASTLFLHPREIRILAGLRQALAAPAGKPAPNPQVSQHLNALGNAMAQGRYADAEQTLNALRSGYASGNPAVETLLDKLLVEIQAATAAASRERDRALDEIVSGTAKSPDTPPPDAKK